LPSHHPDWLSWQCYYLDNPEDYPATGNAKGLEAVKPESNVIVESFQSPIPNPQTPTSFTGIFQRCNEQDYRITLTAPEAHEGQTWTLITLLSSVDEQLQTCIDQERLTVWGRLNESGCWLVVEKIEIP
jgi:hypothetical protein